MYAGYPNGAQSTVKLQTWPMYYLFFMQLTNNDEPTKNTLVWKIDRATFLFNILENTRTTGIVKDLIGGDI